MNSVSLFPFALLLLLAISVPGSIMGWIAAGQIRRSHGSLYGMRLAAFAALAWPFTLLVLLPLAVCLVLIRLADFSTVLDENTALLLIFPILITGGIVGIKLGLALKQRVTKGEPVLAGFFKGMNWLTKGLLMVVWLVIGLLIFLQYPREIDPGLSSESQDRMFSAQGSTVRSMRVFTKDELDYHFVVKGLGGSYQREWVIPIPMDKLAKDYASLTLEDYSFHQQGSIVWGTQILNDQHTGTTHVIFKVGDREVFREELPNSGPY